MGDVARLLGRPAMSVEGEWFEVPSGRRGALWLYIVHLHRWIDRGDLTFLLWPDTEQGRANANLRQILGAVARAPWGRSLERERRRTRCLMETDVTEFLAAADEGRWEDALRTYGGPFLEGFAVDDAPEFMDWLQLERGTLHDRWRSIALHAIDRWLKTGDRSADALRLAERMIVEDPLDEEAARRAMVAADAAGETRRALLVYEALRTGLQHEIGLEPSPGTTTIARSILEEATAVDGVTIDLPEEPAIHDDVFARRFVGRASELDALTEALTDPEVRLLSIVAPAGMGKTWLARALVPRVAGAFADRAVFVRLEDVVGPYALVHAVAHALGARLEPHDELRLQLVSVIGGRELLVILDGFEEHLAEHALLSALLDGCPRLTLLVTSREHLGHSAEWAFELGGLALSSAHPALTAERSDAARLFLRAAARVLGPGRAAELETWHVNAICRTVGGSPLALELCAAWLEIAPIAAVRERLDASWEPLHGEAVDRPTRHRDIHSLLHETWARLPGLDRQAWARLAVLRGSFDHDIAVRVSGTTWSELLRLKRHALIRSVGDRLEMHALVARFGREEAALTGEDERVASDLAKYFGERLGPTHRARAPVLHEDDVTHLRGAWRHAVRTGAFDRLAAMAVGMQRALLRTGRRREAQGLCDEAVAVLEPRSGRDRDVALARILCGASSRLRPPPQRARAALALATGRSDLLAQGIAHASLALGEPIAEARFHHRHAKACFHRADDPIGMIETCLTFGRRLSLSGYYGAGREACDEALVRSEEIASRTHEAEAIARCAEVAALTFDLDAAEARAHEAWELFDRLGVPLRAATCVGTLLWIATIRRDAEATRGWAEAYLALQEGLGQGDSIESALARSRASYGRGANDEAWRHASAVLARVGTRSTGHVADRMRLLMARIALRTGDTGTALGLLRAVLRPHQQVERPRHTVDAAVVAAELALVRRDAAEAHAILQGAARQPAIDADARVEALDLVRTHRLPVSTLDAGPATPLADLLDLVRSTLDIAS